LTWPTPPGDSSFYPAQYGGQSAASRLSEVLLPLWRLKSCVTSKPVMQPMMARIEAKMA
jgi:hypothetical protein